MSSHWGSQHETLIRKGVEATLGERYSGRKYDYKHLWWTKRGGPEHPREIKRFPPPSMDIGEWCKLCDFYNDPKNRTRSEKNIGNRSQMKTRSGHGSKSYAQFREEKVFCVLFNQFSHIFYTNYILLIFEYRGVTPVSTPARLNNTG